MYGVIHIIKSYLTDRACSLHKQSVPTECSNSVLNHLHIVCENSKRPEQTRMSVEVRE